MDSKRTHKELRKLLDNVLDDIKDHPTVLKMFDEYNVDIEEIHLIPLCFDDNLDVSARTDHAIIYLRSSLIDTPEEIAHYLVHEITHYLQQTTGDKPTKGADYGNYLDNDEEIEGFKNQTEYMSDTKGDDEAEKYIEQVLDYHDVDNGERKKRKKELLQLASL